MDKEEPHFNWWPLYKRFGDELVEIIKTEYEWHRNLYARQIRKRFPNAVCQKYSVNPERYGDDVWIELLKSCYDHALQPDVALTYLRTRNAYAMPWPDRLWTTALKDSFHLEVDSRNGTITYLDMLVKMNDDAERRKWIKNRHAAPGNPDAPTDDERLAYRLMFGEFDDIMNNRRETAAGLYEFLNRGKLIYLERYLKGQLEFFFASRYPQSLVI